MEGASVFGFGNGTAKGGSPKARVAAYKVCWPPVGASECFDSDILAAFDVAIHDGVDVLSVSLGGNPTPFFNDSVAIGSFHAVKHGIVVVCSAGNSGPEDGTVSNIAPWQITVGASTIDREFPSYVVLANKVTFKVSLWSLLLLDSQPFVLLPFVGNVEFAKKALFTISLVYDTSHVFCFEGREFISSSLAQKQALPPYKCCKC